MRGLLIKSPYIDLILAEKKTWEIRGSRTKVRGPIALIRSGSGHVVGVCNLVDCLGPLIRSEMLKNTAKHRIAAADLRHGPLPYGRKTHAWVVEGAKALVKAIPYKHPSGAIIWVDLGKAMTPLNRKKLVRT